MYIFRYDYTPTAEEKEKILEIMGDMKINPDDFVRTAPAYIVGSPRGLPTDPILNPQTEKLCNLLGIDDPLQVVLARSGRKMTQVDNLAPCEDAKPNTPQRISRLFLPAPVTPSVHQKKEDDSVMNTDSIINSDMNTSCFSNDINNDKECVTTPASEKKTFKRRNQALYTPHDNDDVTNPVITDSPKSSKLIFKNTLLNNHD